MFDSLLIFITAFAGGFAVAFMLGSRTREQLAATKARAEEQANAAADKLEFVADAKASLKDEFKALSADALSATSRSFLELANENLEKIHERAQGDLDARRKAVDTLVQPIVESLVKVDGKLGEIELKRERAYAALNEQLRGLVETHLPMLHNETAKLVQSLRQPATRGQWGEMQLRRVVEAAGNRVAHRMLVDGVTVEYRRKDGSIAGAQARVIDFDVPDEQRLARGQPVHRGRGPAHAPAGRGAVRQRPAARGDRAQERGRRERDGLVGVPAAPDLPGADPGALRDQRGAGRLRRRAGAHRHARRGQGVVQALAHDRRARATRRASMPELQVVLEGVFEQRRFLDLVRHFIVFEDRGRRQARQEDGGLPPVPCGERRGRGDAARGRNVVAVAQPPAATRPASGRAASPATGASASSGTRRARARA